MIVNEGKTSFSTVEAAWKVWIKADGKNNEGLEARRNNEWSLFTDSNYITSKPSNSINIVPLVK